MSSANTLKMQREFDAPAERVFDAFTNEAVLMRWFRPGTDDEYKTLSARVDLRIGGEIHIRMHRFETGKDFGGGGVFSEIDRPTRLAFTWIWDDDTRGTLIEFDFEEVDGRTLMNFTHSKLWDEETVAEHRVGWDRCWDNLEATLLASR